MREVPQRILLLHLRSVIDLIFEDDRPRVVTGAKRRLRVILRDNPHASWSTYVQYNLGKRRREWLRDFARQSEPAIPLHSKRPSFANFSDDAEELLVNTTHTNFN